MAETLVTAFCSALEFEDERRRPSVDVFELAESAGAEAVLVRELEEDGRVEDSPQATRIFLGTNPSETRRRFTLGHELGHLVLSDPKVFRLVQPALDADRLPVERLCDAFAAELLMPRRWLIKRYRDRHERLDALYDLADSAEVSLSASLTRLSTVLEWESSLLYFHRRSDWAPVVLAGPARSLRLRLGGSTRRTLWDWADETKPAVREIELWMRSGHVKLDCEIRPTPAGALCLMRIPTTAIRHRRPARPSGRSRS